MEALRSSLPTLLSVYHTTNGFCSSAPRTSESTEPYYAYCWSLPFHRSIWVLEFQMHSMLYLSYLRRGLLTYNCTLGGFNVSNLMGIKRRMIDIGKKITFYFLQNVWKCTVFFAFAFKVCKKCYYDPKKLLLENINMGNQKTQNFVPISKTLMPT